MADEGSIVVDALYLHIDYGVTENLTVGVNLLPALPVLAGNLPGTLLRLRYRQYAAGPVSAVATLHGGFLDVDREAEDVSNRFWAFFGTQALEYRLSSR